MTKPSITRGKSANNCKFIGVRISMELYWQIRKRLTEKRLSMSEAIIKGLLYTLDIKSPSKK